METEKTTKSQSVINRSAVKAFALKVSKERRAGKFERVSEEFLQSIEAETEAEIRRVARMVDDEVPLPDDRLLITGAAMSRIQEKLNERVRQIIQLKVHRHPSIGCTLK